MSPPEAQPCLVIGVNYGTDACAIRWARSLNRYRPDSVHVVLVENSGTGGDDDFLFRLGQANPNIVAVRTPKNLGYFGGANFGYEHYCSLHREPPPWVVVCNVDLEFLDDEFFGNLHELDADSTVGIVAPRIWSKRWNSDVNPKIVVRPQRSQMLFYQRIFGNFFLHNSYEVLSAAKKITVRYLRAVRGKQAQDIHDRQVPRLIYAPHGSCIVFHNRFFARGGTLKYGSFLFGEEIFVAETARNLQLSVVYFPLSWVLDDEHASTGIIRSRRIARYMSDSTRFLVETYWS